MVRDKLAVQNLYYLLKEHMVLQMVQESILQGKIERIERPEITDAEKTEPEEIVVKAEGRKQRMTPYVFIEGIVLSSIIIGVLILEFIVTQFHALNKKLY